MNYQVKLDIFEGPVELLLHLIRKEELDICSISIYKIINEYLEYVHLMQELDLEEIAEFLVLAATLLEIKSKKLLPQEVKEVVEEELEEELREVLKAKLEEYRKYKEVSLNLREWEQSMGLVFSRPPSTINWKEEVDFDGIEGEKISIFDLLSSLKVVLKKAKSEPLSLERQGITIEAKMEEILSSLVKKEKGIRFEELFEKDYSRPNIIVTFIALLELIKQRRVIAWQFRLFGEIRISLR